MQATPDHSPGDLLATKFYKPHARASLVQRPHLTEQHGEGWKGR